MAKNVTATYTTINVLATLVNRETHEFEELSVTLIGEHSTDQIRRYCERNLNTDTKLYLSHKIISTVTAKYSMSEERFIQFAHIVEENESRLSLITRTMRLSDVYVTMINRESLEIYTENKVLTGSIDEKAVIKLYSKDYDETSAFVRVDKIEPHEMLLGLAKEDFILYADEREAC